MDLATPADMSIDLTQRALDAIDRAIESSPSPAVPTARLGETAEAERDQAQRLAAALMWDLAWFDAQHVPADDDPTCCRCGRPHPCPDRRHLDAINERVITDA